MSNKTIPIERETLQEIRLYLAEILAQDKLKNIETSQSFSVRLRRKSLLDLMAKVKNLLENE